MELFWLVALPPLVINRFAADVLPAGKPLVMAIVPGLFKEEPCPLITIAPALFVDPDSPTNAKGLVTCPPLVAIRDPFPVTVSDVVFVQSEPAPSIVTEP